MPKPEGNALPQRVAGSNRGLQLVVAYDSGDVRASGRLEQRVPVRVGDLRDVPLRVAHEGHTLTAEERMPSREKVSLLPLRSWTQLNPVPWWMAYCVPSSVVSTKSSGL